MMWVENKWSNPSEGVTPEGSSRDNVSLTVNPNAAPTPAEPELFAPVVLAARSFRPKTANTPRS